MNRTEEEFEIFQKNLDSPSRRLINITDVTTETILREDGTVYDIVDYVGDLKLRLDIIKGDITEKLYYKNIHGGISEINKHGNSDHYSFDETSTLLRDIIHAQMTMRIEDHTIEERTDTIDEILGGKNSEIDEALE